MISQWVTDVCVLGLTYTALGMVWLLIYLIYKNIR